MVSSGVVVFKTIPSYLLALALLGFPKEAAADSFMDTWLARQTSQTHELARQVASQVAPATPFNQDDWLARQKAKGEGDGLVGQVAAQAASVDSFSQEAWLSRQEGSSPSASQDGAFSQGAWTPAASWEADEELERSLLADIEGALGREHRRALEGRIAVVEERMRQMFQALPKNEYGKLGHPSARYMLHRFFVEQHGWFIDGLFSEGAALNTSSPSHMLKDRVPMFVQGIFEKRLGGRGFGVHEMAVLVAVVEDSVHQEAQVQLNKTYGALRIPFEKHFSRAEAKAMIEVYMSGFVLATNMSEVSRGDLLRQRHNMILYYPTWLRAQGFFEKVRQDHTAGQQKISFVQISSIVRELVDTFGTFHGKQCQGLKQSLKGLESKGSSGCVKLPDFYDKGLKADTNWLFVESPDYLRHIGVLDEGDPQNPRLLTANYINSPTNCLSPSGYYMVCCHNECDDILGQLEQHLGSPGATPSDILVAMGALRTTSSFSASSLRAGRLAPALRQRLEEVADHHGGRVPIHGRLFAQWLHHVFPHECPYPHVSGTKRLQWIEDFEAETGKSSQLTGAEMASWVHNPYASHLHNASRTPQPNRTLAADVGSCAPWQREEELFAPLPRVLPLHALENDPHVWNVAGGIAFLGAASTLVISLLRTFKSLSKLSYQSKMLQV